MLDKDAFDFVGVDQNERDRGNLSCTTYPFLQLRRCKSVSSQLDFILLIGIVQFCSHITEFWIRTANYDNSIAAATILPIIFGNVLSAAVNSRIVQRCVVSQEKKKIRPNNQTDGCPGPENTKSYYLSTAPLR